MGCEHQITRKRRKSSGLQELFFMSCINVPFGAQVGFLIMA